MFRSVSAAILALTPMMLTAQSESTSMAQCAAIYAASQDGLRNEDARLIMEHGQGVWMDAAISQAEAEGADDPEGYVIATFSAKTAEFDIGGRYLVSAGDYAYWMDYCRLFAFEQGISLLP